MLQKVERWYENNMNYATITALMTVESSFIPFPSEIVIPPAAYIASKPESNLNIFLVVLFGTIGALLGAFINYGLALWLGRPIIHKFADSKVGHLLLLSSEKITKAENYFNNHGKVSTFVGRLIPGIRQLISIPAGIAKMNLVSFSIYTALGAGIWNGVLALLGYAAHGQADLINKYSHEIGYIIAGVVILIIAYFIIKKIVQKKKKSKLSEE
ncbi:DedA family protein [Paludibacter sp. 221]|uniref:DedA family protein n=1 Tax=Paludibacter sp. 221 TaxID=2302939 RepID=UPI0013D4ABAC|nr:DedA family protein [Paludibacter sp. 221]NDV46324.1 DedA family protein [Paludibacter sp. 221]